jgi:hypothetical protein
MAVHLDGLAVLAGGGAVADVGIVSVVRVAMAGS